MPLQISEVLKELAVTQKKKKSKHSKYGINLQNSEMWTQKQHAVG